MVLSTILHLARVYLTAGFKKPREILWISGILLAIASVPFGITGYSLPWDQVAYWAADLVTATPEAFDNLVGSIGSALVIGGASLNLFTESRKMKKIAFLVSHFSVPYCFER